MEQRHDDEAAIIRRERERVRECSRADAQMFLCASGTILGRDVVPDVCSTSAMSSGVAGAPACAGRSRRAVELEREACPRPAPDARTSRAIGTPSFSATPTAGESLPCATTSSFARRSVR